MQSVLMMSSRLSNYFKAGTAQNLLDGLSDTAPVEPWRFAQVSMRSFQLGYKPFKCPPFSALGLHPKAKKSVEGFLVPLAFVLG